MHLRWFLDSMIDNGQLAQGVQTILLLYLCRQRFLIWHILYFFVRLWYKNGDCVRSWRRKREFLKILAGKILISLVGISILLFLGRLLFGNPNLIYCVCWLNYRNIRQNSLTYYRVEVCIHLVAVLDNALVVTQTAIYIDTGIVYFYLCVY